MADGLQRVRPPSHQSDLDAELSPPVTTPLPLWQEAATGMYPATRRDAIYVCSPQTCGAVCGNLAQGFPRIDWSTWIRAWCSHAVATRMALVPTKCLGACGHGNVVMISARGRQAWLRGVEPQHISGVLSYAFELSVFGAVTESEVTALAFGADSTGALLPQALVGDDDDPGRSTLRSFERFDAPY